MTRQQDHGNLQNKGLLGLTVSESKRASGRGAWQQAGRCSTGAVPQSFYQFHKQEAELTGNGLGSWHLKAHLQWHISFNNRAIPPNPSRTVSSSIETVWSRSHSDHHRKVLTFQWKLQFRVTIQSQLTPPTQHKKTWMKWQVNRQLRTLKGSMDSHQDYHFGPKITKQACETHDRELETLYS